MPLARSTPRRAARRAPVVSIHVDEPGSTHRWDDPSSREPTSGVILIRDDTELVALRDALSIAIRRRAEYRAARTLSGPVDPAIWGALAPWDRARSSIRGAIGRNRAEEAVAALHSAGLEVVDVTGRVDDPGGLPSGLIHDAAPAEAAPTPAAGVVVVAVAPGSAELASFVDDAVAAAGSPPVYWLHLAGFDAPGAATALRAAWSSARGVLLDEATAAVAHGLRLPTRDEVLLLAGDDPPGTVWERAVGVGAEHVVSLPAGRDFLTGYLRGPATT